MATFAQVAKAALQLILTQESEGEYSADEYQDAMFALNNMMAAWENAESISLGFTDIESLSDTVTVDAGAIRGIVANLAVELAPQFDAEITSGLSYQAKEGMKACRILGQAVVPTAYPERLPVGSGNEGGGFRSSHFYSEEVEAYDNVVTGDAQVITDG